MNKLFSVLSAVAVVGAMASAPASAFWGGGPWSNQGGGGGPWSGMSDMFGGGDVNFNAKSYGQGNGYGYGNPYMNYQGYGQPGYGGYPGGYGGGYPGGYGGYPGGYGGSPYGYGAPPAPPAAPVAPR